MHAHAHVSTHSLHGFHKMSDELDLEDKKKAPLSYNISRGCRCGEQGGVLSRQQSAKKCNELTLTRVLRMRMRPLDSALSQCHANDLHREQRA